MTTISFYVEGLPKGQPRARAFSFAGKARMYDPGTAEGWKGQIAAASKEFKPSAMIETPAQLVLVFHMPRPQKHFKKDELRFDAPAYFTGKPDADNLAKAVMDALTNLGWWKDDALVWSLQAEKRYSDNKDRSGMSLVMNF